MFSKEILEQKLQQLKPYLKEEFGVETIGYFGSMAKGNFRNDSDIDLLVSFSKPIGWDFFDLKDYLEKKLDKKVDLVTENSLKKQWKPEILSQTIYV